VLEIVDRTKDEPWQRSLATSALIRQLRDHSRTMVCVLNSVGRARLLACKRCRALQRCEVCEAAVAQRDDSHFECARCGTVRPPVCQACGAAAFAALKVGVSRLRDELEAAAGRPVVAVTGKSTDHEPLPIAGVYVGTEAALHRVRQASTVAFVDFDAELLAPRYRATEQAMTLLARAARLVGGRAGGGRLLVQTFLPHHEVLDAVLHADPGRLMERELVRRRMLGFPPASAIAVVTGDGAADYGASLRAAGVESAATLRGDVLLRAPDWDALGRAIAAHPRPKGTRLRIEVDPPRL
jgi:primosomal protein N' (replication factor Y)